jgi:hypothetical protein
MRTHESVCNELAAGKQEPTTHPASLVETLRAGLAADPAIARAWLVEQRALLAGAGKTQVTVRVDALI